MLFVKMLYVKISAIISVVIGLEYRNR